MKWHLNYLLCYELSSKIIKIYVCQRPQKWLNPINLPTEMYSRISEGIVLKFLDSTFDLLGRINTSDFESNSL